MRNILLFIAFSLAAGCQPMTVMRQDDGAMPVTLRVDDAAYWLEEWYRILEMPASQVEQSIKAREDEFSREPDPRNRLRLALLLSEGPQSVRDARRAYTLLTQLDKAQASPSARALAALLSQVVREQLSAGDKIATLKQGLSDSETRVKELERQLQELTNIEQSIQQRETPVERKE